MSREASLISETQTPLTINSIAHDLKAMGLAKGDVVLMHVGLSKLGWICGGEQAVITAVQSVIGTTGTLAMPGFSSQLSDPADWTSPPVPAGWVQVVQDNMPVFDQDKTPTRGMGRVGECFRKWPGTFRSDHPVDSFLANGPLARELVANHPLGNSLGPKSPLGKLHDHGAKVLLLGTGYGSCTTFHLAECDLPGNTTITENYPNSINRGKTTWSGVAQPETHEEKFIEIGAILDAVPGAVTTGFADAARLFSMETAVHTAKTWLGEYMSRIMAQRPSVPKN